MLWLLELLIITTVIGGATGYALIKIDQYFKNKTANEIKKVYLKN